MANLFHINKNYAEKYNNWRQKEELKKLKDRYGDVEDESSSSSESEDEDAEAITPKLQEDWLKTLRAIKNKDPSIYDNKVTFYRGEDSSSDDISQKEAERKKKQKPMFLKDYERKLILEKEGKISDSESDESERPKGPSYFQEQEQLKHSFKSAFEGDESDDELFVKKRKSNEEKEEEDREYSTWLKQHKPRKETKETSLGECSEQASADADKYLTDYFENKRYLEESEERIPTYDEIVADEAFSDEEDILSKQDTFEHKFNFRFEEPDPDFVKRYPRSIDESVRRKDDRRKRKRKEIRDRKLEEKQKKKEEIKQLKNLKRQEIMNKLEQLKDITGNPSLAFTEDDMQGDFDPKQYDTLMKKMFDKEYYDMEEGEEKPVFNDDEDINLQDEDWDNWQGNTENYHEGGDYNQSNEAEPPYCEDPEFNMDADYDPYQEQSSSSHIKSTKSGRRKSKFHRALEKKKPVFNPDEKTFEEYFDEYYKLDYEDIVDDIPCRFKYRQVLACDFGLNTEEIMACPDKELNQWVSLKKMSQYRPEDEEWRDMKKYRKKGRSEKTKSNILISLNKVNEEEEEEPVESTKKKKKKKKKKSLQLGSNPVTKDVHEATSASQKRPGEPLKQTSKKLRAETPTSSGLLESQRKRETEMVNTEQPTQQTPPNYISERTSSKNTHDPQNKQKKKKLKDLSESNKVQAAEPVRQLSSDHIQGPYNPAAPDSHRKKKKNKDKRETETKIQKQTTAKLGADLPNNGASKPVSQNVQNKKKKKKRKAIPDMSAERLKAYGINPKKFKYTQHKRLSENN